MELQMFMVKVLNICTKLSQDYEEIISEKDQEKLFQQP